MLLNLNLFAAGCLLLAAGSHSDEIPPPENLTLLWIRDFEPELSWTTPPGSPANCSYVVNSKTNEKNGEKRKVVMQPRWTTWMTMEGGFLQFSVKTVCNNKESQEKLFINRDPEMVKNLECSIHSSKHAHCSWVPASPTSTLRFFYRLTDKYENVSAKDFQECSLYVSTKGVRDGCNLQEVSKRGIYALFNGTVNETSFRNTFYRGFQSKPNALEWTVINNGSNFIISWKPPDIRKQFEKFRINYTKCGEQLVKVVSHVTSTDLNRSPECQYSMVIRAENWEGNATPWSEPFHFEAETHPTALLYTIIIIPLMLASLVVLTFVCCRKNKKNFFPKIPQPRDLISDISDNNNKSNICKLYVPEEEEENCKVTLVMDPQSNKPAAY